MVEQRQYRPSRSRKGARKTPTSDMEQDMPEHDLEPPRRVAVLYVVPENTFIVHFQ